MNSKGKISIIFALISTLIILLLIAPLIGLLLSSSKKELFNTINDAELIDALILTFCTGGLTTLSFAFLAVPLAYFMARTDFFGKQILMSVIDLPMMMPQTAVGIAILSVISRDTIPGQLSSMIGIDMIKNPIGIGLAMAFVSVGYLINTARNGFEQVPVKLEKAAMLLGASPFYIFRTIALPLAWRNVISGMVMMFSRSISEFGAVVIIAYYPHVGTTLIFDRFINGGIESARPAAIVFLILSLLIFIAAKVISNKFDKNNILIKSNR